MSELTANEQSETPGLKEEQELEAALSSKFPSLAGKFKIQRARRVWVDVELGIFNEVFEYCVKELNFPWLATITGTDEGEKLGMIYHLTRDEGLMLNMTVQIARDELGPQSVMNLFPVAELYEREVIDLLGINVQGLPEGPRYPLPEDWPDGQYPLRKEWKLDQLDVKGSAEKGGTSVEEAKK